MGARGRLVAGVAALILGPAVTHAQATAGEARMLERRGRYEDAATEYRAVLAGEPASAAAWTGLERVLRELDRLETIFPLLDSTLVSFPEYELLHELRLRIWAHLDEPDNVAAAARSWIEEAPGSLNPYRQWAYVLSNVGNRGDALAVLEEARARFGETVLSAEMAELRASAGQWAAAAREWSRAVVESQSGLAAAAVGLRQVPESRREEVLEVLSRDNADPPVRRLAAELLVLWNRPDDGWSVLVDALSSDRAEAALELRMFADRVHRIRTAGASRARAMALDRLSDLVGDDHVARARLDAANAFADAGDFTAARKMLDRLSNAAAAIPEDAAAAAAALIMVTAESGRIDEAEQRLRSLEGRLRPSEAQLLREQLAWAWVLAGEPERAHALLRSDSSVSAIAILGWAALFSGELGVARERFLAAGPFALSREQATRRTSMLALIQGVDPDTVPALGEALLWLERADTLRALDGLEAGARTLPADGGRSAVLTFAGGLAREHGDWPRAESLLVDALLADSLGPSAPTAEYTLGIVLAGSGKNEAAVARLEHMILSFPGSALVPEARRLLDQVLKAIPRQ